MITPLWFSNALDWIAQVALLVLAAGLLPHIFKIKQPKVLLAFWRTVVGVSLLLPLLQPWRRQSYPLVEFTAFATVTLSKSELSRLASTAGHLNYWQAHKADLIAQTFAVVILAGIAARFSILALGLLKLRQFRRASSPIANHTASSAVLDDMRVRVNTGGEFRISSDVESPVTFGLSAPVILLPERFPTLDAQYQSAIACHELLHVRRCDWAHHLSEEILRAALWFHPAIAWLISRIRLSREQVVDLEVVRLTDARKPYLEALLEFTNSHALATAIPAPPFLVERQLAERVALMLKEVRMSRARLIASLTAIAACLAVVATLAVWTFPLKAAPQYSLPPIQDPNKAEVHVVPGLIVSGITQGVPGGVVVGTTVSGVANGIINGVPGGVVGGVKNGVPGGITTGQSSPSQSSNQHYLVGGVSVDPIPGSPGKYLIHANPPVPVQSPSQQDDKSAQTIPLITTKRVPPVYPHAAIEKHLQGSVNLTLTINAAGKVSDVEFINGSPEFVQAATDAMFQWEFQPPAKAPAIMTASIYFTLSPSRPPAPFVEAPKDHRAVSSLSVEVTAQDPSPQSAPAPATTNDSRFVGKFQYIPPATASSQNFHLIPPVDVSSPRGVFLIQPGDPQPPTNRGVFLSVAPSEPTVSRNPNSQNATGQIARAGENGFGMPVCVYCPRPEYSPEARDANVHGTVYLQVIVLATGRAGEIKLIKGFEKSLDEQAIKVVREQWTFKPATDRNGNPVDVTVPVEIAFQWYQAPNGVSAPVCEYCPKPEYSSEAKKARLMGTVYLQVTVLPNGRAGEVKLSKGLGMGLDEKAIEVVKKKWKFNPAIGPNGKPVISVAPVEIQFELY